MPGHISTEEERLIIYNVGPEASFEKWEGAWWPKEFDPTKQDALRDWAAQHGPYANYFTFDPFAQSQFMFGGEFSNWGGITHLFEQAWFSLCELLFALRRRWEPSSDPIENYGHGETIHSWFNYFRNPSELGEKYIGRLPYYWYWDDTGGLDYRWALYTSIADPELITGSVAMFKGREIPRTDQYLIYPITGQNISQGGTAGPGPESDSNSQKFIPPFPHWDDKIIEKFHRSTDPEMDEYNESLDNWSALMSNIINRIA